MPAYADLDTGSIQKYWDAHPLYSLETNAVIGSPEFFEAYDKIRSSDVERFASGFWRFKEARGKSVLDVGCGIGWISMKYAEVGANLVSFDVSSNSLRLARLQLANRRCKFQSLVANAEHMPFGDNQFDLVVCGGVLHHVPDMDAAIREIYRVLKPGGEALITLYFTNFYLSRTFFPLLRLLLKLFAVSGGPGREKIANAKSSEEFVRTYDGEENPLGRCFTRSECLRKFRAFKIASMEVHYFPKRFVPFGSWIPDFAHYLLDKYLGTMIYLRLVKSEDKVNTKSACRIQSLEVSHAETK